MAVDTPATIGIIGAGPTGLEAALYARFLGYQVAIFERDRVCSELDRTRDELWPAAGHTLSPLGMAALEAQGDNWCAPSADAQLTAAELVANYYHPLADSDLLADSLHLGYAVTHIERAPRIRADEDDEDFEDENSAADYADDSEDADDQQAEDELLSNPGFAITARSAFGDEISVEVDLVIDASGLPADHTSDWQQSLGLAAMLEAGSPHAFARWLADQPGESVAMLTGAAGLLVLPADHYYVVGRKSFGRDGRFEMRHAHEQIRWLFGRIGGRAGLDLYRTVRPHS